VNYDADGKVVFPAVAVEESHKNGQKYRFQVALKMIRGSKPAQIPA
jgi:hypothetical protein